MSDRVVTVVVAEDHRLTREGTAALLRADHRVRVVGLAADGDEAIEVALQTRPSVVLLDLNIPDRNGIEVAAILRQRLPESRVLILTASQREDDLYAAMRVGAVGYLLKDVPPHHLINAVLDVDQGDPLIDATIAARILQDLALANDAAAVAARRSDAGLTADLSFVSETFWRCWPGGPQSRDRRCAVRIGGHGQDPRPPYPRQTPCPQPGGGCGVCRSRRGSPGPPGRTRLKCRPVGLQRRCKQNHPFD